MAPYLVCNQREVDKGPSSMSDTGKEPAPTAGMERPPRADCHRDQVELPNILFYRESTRGSHARQASAAWAPEAPYPQEQWPVLHRHAGHVVPSRTDTSRIRLRVTKRAP